MCGIVGYVGRQPVVPVLLEGLARVEYRGYDSAGIAVLSPRDELKVYRRRGKLGALTGALPRRLAGRVGIGHTRWATHGEPSDENAHPHVDAAGRVAIIHNGIIENAAELRALLEAGGVELTSETDSECLAHLVADRLAQGDVLEEAVRNALADVEGTYGLAVIDAGHPDRIVVARRGLARPARHRRARDARVASDAAALVRYTRQVVTLDDGELAVLTADGYRTFGLDMTPTQKRSFAIDWSPDDLDRGGHEHFMRKEILEQPQAIERALRRPPRRPLRHRASRRRASSTRASALGIRRVRLLGCGTAYYAGLAGAQLIEDIARIPADAEPAAEFRYRNPVIEQDTLYVAISQSGETADTLAAVQEVNRRGGRTLALVNVVGSTDRPRVRRHLPARRARGLRRLHQGVHLDAGLPRPARAAPRPRARPRAGRRRAPDRRPARPAGQGRARAGAGGRDRRHRGALRRPLVAVLRRAPPRLSDRARGRAEAEGDLLHPRGGVPGERAQARPAGARLARVPGRRDRARTTTCGRRTSRPCSRCARAAGR